MGQRAAGVALASVLAADVEDASAKHGRGDVGPAGEARLGLQLGVALGADFLVDEVDVHVL